MSAQTFVYSTVYSFPIRDAGIQQYLKSLISLCTSTLIIDMPLEQRNKLMKQLNELFFSDAKGQMAPNAIYKTFLINLMNGVESDTFNRDMLQMLRSNLTYIEESRITGFIPHQHHSEDFISNSYIVAMIQDKLQNGTVVNALNQPAVSVNNVFRYGNQILEKKGYGKASKTRKNVQPYSKQPCKYGAQCYRTNPEHLRNFSHPSKGGKRTSKKVYQCVRQTKKKYTSRASPPYPAQECPHKKKKGNDGRMYVSKPNDINGIFRWVAI